MNDRELLRLQTRWKYLKNEYLITGSDKIQQQCEETKKQIIDELNKRKGKKP